MRDLLGQEIKKGDVIAYAALASDLAIAVVNSFSEEAGTVTVVLDYHSIHNIYGSRCLVVTKQYLVQKNGSKLSDRFGSTLEVGDWVISTRPYSVSLLIGKITDLSAREVGSHVELEVVGSAIKWLTNADSLVRITDLPALVPWLITR